jgi:hypothetical protein
MKPNTLDDDQRISIDTEPLNDATFRVSDTVVEDIGITQVVGVTLLSGFDAAQSGATCTDDSTDSSECERYAIEWATHSDTAVVSHLDFESSDSEDSQNANSTTSREGDSEWEVNIEDIQTVEE